MSTLKVNTIQNTSGTEMYLAKAWVNFDGTFGTSPFTVANGGIRAAGNVTSVTDNGVGRYVVNFTNAMPDTDYSYAFGAWNNGTGNGGWVSSGTGSGSYPTGISTTSLSIVCLNYAGTDQDNPSISVVIFR